MGSMERPDVEQVSGLSPVISIEQKTVSKNPRSTVGTITEVYDFMRLLFARAGEAYSYETGKKMVQFTDEQIIEHILTQFDEKKAVILSPLVRSRKGHYRELFEQLHKKGYLKVRVDGEIVNIEPGMQLDRYKIHDIEAVVDRLKINEANILRIRSAIQMAMQQGNGLMFLLDVETNKLLPFSKKLMCPDTGISYDEPSPNAFSYNSPYGYCPACKGIGYTQEMDLKLVIPNDKKSINEGGLAPRRNIARYRHFSSVKKNCEAL